MQHPIDSAPRHVPSLDGLRTIAVFLVIAFHLKVPHMAMGFAGVDVFFVLSGYLITAGLLRDTVRHGHPRYASFWERRFKRLLPAATLVLLAVLLHASLFEPLFRRPALSADVTWTAVYLANWHFMGANSYFSSDGRPSPLLHMWSLAVEEQFYFAWPLIIGLVALVVRRARRDGRVARALGVVAALSVVASAVLLGVLHHPDAADRAYMGTDTKAFEPLLGALLAIVVTHPTVRRVGATHHRLLVGIGGVLALAVTPFLAGPSQFYFRGGALALSVGVALVIGGLVLSSAPTAVSRVLSWGPIAYLGQISYGLYLWHWPWSVWLGVAEHDGYRMLRAPAALAATMVCAVASYHLFEQPIRRGAISRWLTPRRLVATVAAVMALVLGWSYALVNAAGGAGERSILVVGDSVPYRLMDSLDEVASGTGFVIDSAARGGCPPLAIELQEFRKPDHEGFGDCRVVADIQTEKLEQLQPRWVFWWSRYEVHQRWIDDRIVGPDQEEFWTALDADLQASVDRLTATGATLVIAQTERPGLGMRTRCNENDCHPLLDVMTNHDEYRRRWNDMVVALAERDSRVRTFRMDPVLCLDPEPTAPVAPDLCDDRRGSGYLRPDGSHVDVELYGTEIARAVLDQVLAAG